jgi:hypothetical protein
MFDSFQQLLNLRIAGKALSGSGEQSDAFVEPQFGPEFARLLQGVLCLSPFFSPVGEVLYLLLQRASLGIVGFHLQDLFDFQGCPGQFSFSHAFLRSLEPLLGQAVFFGQAIYFSE